MTATIIGIRADDNIFHIPCATRVYGDDAIYLVMYREVYESEGFVLDSGEVPINTMPVFSVSPEQRDFSGHVIEVVMDDEPSYEPQLCAYPLCRHSVDGTDVMPENAWRNRHDTDLRRYILRYSFQTLVQEFEHGMIVQDCPVEQLGFYLARFMKNHGNAGDVPSLYIGGNNLQPLARYRTLTSIRPLRVLARTAEEVSLDFDQKFSLPVRSLTGVWETVVLLRTPGQDAAPSYFMVPAGVCKRLYALLCAVTDLKEHQEKTNTGEALLSIKVYPQTGSPRWEVCLCEGDMLRWHHIDTMPIALAEANALAEELKVPCSIELGTLSAITDRDVFAHLVEEALAANYTVWHDKNHLYVTRGTQLGIFLPTDKGVANARKVLQDSTQERNEYI